jgi:ABC-type glycerol-3-phosphate transport system substrate-binding protein
MTMGQRSSLLAWTCFAAFALLQTGCPSSQPASKKSTEAAPAVPLKVLVVDDPALAMAIGRLQGEWQGQGGGGLDVQQTTSAELRARTELGADVIVFPERELPALADRQWLFGLDRDLESAAEYQWSDVFPALRDASARWGSETLSVPLGSRVLLLAIKTGEGSAPKSWPELLDRKTAAGEAQKCALPLADGSAGATLLAWAAPLVRHPDYYSAVFNKDTFEPQIASPPFVRALEQLAQAAAQGHPKRRELTPTDAVQAVERGEADWAIGWPAPTADRPSASTEAATVRFAPLPGSSEAFNPLRNLWDRLEAGPKPTPLLGLEGRLVAVSASAVDSLAAFRLLALLSGPQWGGEIAPLSPATAPFRGRHVSPPAWAVAPPADAASYASAVADSLNGPRSLSVPRIPGQSQYMAALDLAVQQVVRGEAKPQAALEMAAETWRKVTAELGLEKQRAAYQRSLGLATP